jgi:hypothetical protein
VFPSVRFLKEFVTAFVIGKPRQELRPETNVQLARLPEKNSNLLILLYF